MIICLKYIDIFTASWEIEQVVWSSDASVFCLGDAQFESQSVLVILTEGSLVFLCLFR